LFGGLGFPRRETNYVTLRQPMIIASSAARGR